jgi:hypothetical protein
MIYLGWNAFLIPTVLAYPCTNHGNLIDRKRFVCASCQKEAQYQEYNLGLYNSCLLFLSQVIDNSCTFCIVYNLS